MTAAPVRVLTVCTGNICRSPMAEYVLRDALEQEGLGDRVEVASLGTTGWEVGNPIDPRAGAILREHGLDPSAHRARATTREELAGADLVLALDHDHLGPLRRMLGDRAEDTLFMLRDFDPAEPEDTGIRDPWYGGEEDFQTVWDQITAATEGLVPAIKERLAPRDPASGDSAAEPR